MEKYCIFLRGINAGGVKIKMEALKEVLCEMGFSNVVTILATGNAVVSVPDGKYGRKEWKSFIEKGLGEAFHYDAHVFLRSKAEIAGIYSAACGITIPEGCHHYVLLCDDGQLLLELQQLFGSLSHIPHEELYLSKGEAFWIVPKGATLESVFGTKVLGNKKYKSMLTSRNIHTIEKVHQLLQKGNS